jgi:hypothetical protein
VGAVLRVAVTCWMAALICPVTDEARLTEEPGLILAPM